MKKSTLLFIIICFLWSCSINQKREEKSIELNNWHILGPFIPDNQEDYLQFDNLKKWGYTEKQIDYASFNNITPDSGITNSIYRNDSVIIDFCKHFGIDPFQDNISGNAYAACSFETDDTTGFYIDFTSDDGGKVFLNHKEIINLEKADLVAKYEVYQPIKLNKGKNFILVKVNNGLYNWQAYIKIEKFREEGMKDHKNLMDRLNNNKFFALSLYDTTSILTPAKGLPDTRLKYEIYSRENSLVQSGEVYKNQSPYPDVSGIADGVYLAKLSAGDSEFNQDIYIGDLLSAIKSSIQRLESFNTPDQELRANIDANVFRFNHLLKPENRGDDSSEKHEWQRKLIYLYKTFTEIERNIASNRTVQGIPHTVIRSFISKIDNQPQYYVSHVPRDYNSEMKYPVVILTPYRISGQSYLESMRVADIKLMENLQYLSDRYGMIILEPCCREMDRFNFNSIGETDFFEVLNSAKRNYNIDTTRIFLTGTCAGADWALKFAVKYSSLFAGMGIVSPAFSTGLSYQEWYRKNLPFEYVENLKNMPVYIIHSENDRHTSINNSLFFEQQAKDNRLENFTFVHTKDDIEEYFWYKFADRIFDFFKEIQPTAKSSSATLKLGNLKYNTNQTVTVLARETRDISSIALKVKNNKIRVESSNVRNFSIDVNKLQVNFEKPVSIFENGKKLFSGTLNGNSVFVKNPDSDSKSLLKNNIIAGPFTEIFTDRFILVIGSRGTEQETEKNEKIAQFFNDAWKCKYFNQCMIKYDREITDQDIEHANLFCIGDFKTNKILNEIEREVPLSISDETVTIGNHMETGKDLNTYFVYPNPENRNKYIGIFSGDISQDVIDMMDIEEIAFRNLLQLYEADSVYFDISCFGWYDFKIWDTSGNSLYSGYFDDYWQNNEL